MSEEPDDADAVDAHLADLDDGCGCVEVWAHTSEQRTDVVTDDADDTDDASSE